MPALHSIKEPDMLKKIALATALVSAFVLSPKDLMAARHHARVEEVDEERDSDITVNPLGLVFGLGNATYERALSRENSWLVGANFGSYGVTDNRLTILGAMGAYRWWFNGRKALSGWYAGPEVKIETVTWAFGVDNSNYNATASFFGGGGQGGYQWVFRNGFTLNLGLNLDFMAGSLSTNITGAPTPGFGGLCAGANLGLGYAF
jgi:hypothetical protein